ncbi:MAG: hypothetical protein AAFN41_07630 [Planctomycetota bacterium]
MKNAFCSVVCVCLSFVASSPFAQPSDESLVSVHLLTERVVDVMQWDLLEPGIDPELLPVSSQSAAQTWPEAADLLDEHAPHLDELCELFALSEASAVHNGVFRQSSRVFRADIARAVELGDRERAARRFAGMLNAVRHTMRTERALIGRLIGLSILSSATDAFEILGPDRFDPEMMRTPLDQLARSQPGWVIMSKSQPNQDDQKRKLAAIFAAYNVDPGTSLETPNVLPPGFEGTWEGSLGVSHTDDSLYFWVRLQINRSKDDPRQVSVEVTYWNRLKPWVEGQIDSWMGITPEWFGANDEEPESSLSHRFQREDHPNNLWIKTVEREGNKGTELVPIRSTHLTYFTGGRLHIVDLTPMGLSATGSIMSVQLTKDDAIEFEVQTLEARTITAMPAASGLWTGRLERAD